MITSVETPEAHRLVCRVEIAEPLGIGTQLFESVAEAHGLPLIQRILGLAGVRSVVARGGLLLVGRDGAVTWDEILPGLRALGAAPGDEAADEQSIWNAVWDVLDRQINPSVASHGGSIELAEVNGRDIVLVMKGGCQGCSAAAMTLRGGVERAIRAAVPQVREIRDVTDHDAGASPYFS